jgi:hypothetical protein
VAASDDSRGFACAVMSTGAVECWGDDQFGELGDGGAVSHSSTPVVVPGLGGVTALSAGSASACALLASGGVECWGSDSKGQLGNGTTGVTFAPAPVSGMANATAIAVGQDFACALVSGGTVQCWGDNAEGQLGNGTTSDSPVPVTVQGLTGAVALSAGGAHACAVLASGAVECWGYNANGQLGNGTTASSSVPVPVSGLGAATGVAAGGAFTCALASSAVDCWGANTTGQLGNDSTASGSAIPVAVSGLDGSTVLSGLNGAALSAGLASACVSLSGGAARCWGSNDSGQLGNGTQVHAPVPVVTENLGVARSSVDQTNYPGLGGTNPDTPTESQLACNGQLSFGERFVAGRTGPLLGVGLALDTTAMCDAAPSSHVFVHVFSLAASSAPGLSSNFTDIDVSAAPCATWAGGSAGSFLYVPTTSQPVLIAGNTYGIYVTADSCPSPFCFDGTFANSQGPSRQVGVFYGQYSDFSSLKWDLVFATSMGDPWAFTNDTDPSLQYRGGGWGYYPGRPASFNDAQNDVHATTNNGDSVSFSFTGTGVTYISELSNGYGLVDVYLDGQFEETVDANAPGSQQPLDDVGFSALANSGGHALFSAEGLAAGQHTIRLVKRSGVYMLVDGFVVQP